MATTLEHDRVDVVVLLHELEGFGSVDDFVTAVEKNERLDPMIRTDDLVTVGAQRVVAEEAFFARNEVLVKLIDVLPQARARVYARVDENSGKTDKPRNLRGVESAEARTNENGIIKIFEFSELVHDLTEGHINRRGRIVGDTDNFADRLECWNLRVFSREARVETVQIYIGGHVKPLPYKTSITDSKGNVNS